MNNKLLKKMRKQVKKELFTWLEEYVKVAPLKERIGFAWRIVTKKVY